MVSTFGDDDPEDGWDRADAIPDQLANLRRRLERREADYRARADRGRIAAMLTVDLVDLEFVLSRVLADG